MKKKIIDKMILIIVIAGVLILSIFILNSIIPQKITYDTTFAVRDITDEYRQFLTASEGFYDFSCSRGCSNTDPIKRQLIFNHFDSVISNEGEEISFVVVSRNKLNFKLFSSGGLPDDYNIREIPFLDDGYYSIRGGNRDWNYNDQIQKNKYVYLVRMNYIPKIYGFNYPSSSFINIELIGVNSPTLANIFTIEIHRDTTIKRGFEFVYD